MKNIAAVIVALVVLVCGYNTLAEDTLNAGKIGGVKSEFPLVEVIVSGGSFVGSLDELQPGWYSISPMDEMYTKLSIFDCHSHENPVLIADYAWWEDGASLLQETPEEYTVPLWTGCLVLSGYHSELIYNTSTGEASWEQYDESGRVKLTYVAPLASDSQEATAVEAFEASIGTYEAGESFPIGVYRITCSPNAKWTTVSVYNVNDKLEHSQVMHYEEGGEMGRIEIKEGYRIKIDKGAALFEPSNGGITPVQSQGN